MWRRFPASIAALPAPGRCVARSACQQRRLQNDGDYRAGSGDINGALESFRKKIVIDQQSVTADPDNVQAQGDHAYSSERIGVLLMQLGNYLEAVPNLYENLKTRENIAAHDPQSVDERYKVSVAQGEIATAQAHLGNSSQALEKYGQCLTLLQQLPVDPTKMYLRGVEAQAYGWLGRAQVELANRTGPAEVKDRWRAARDSYQRALDIWQDLQARRTLAADDVPKLSEAVNEIAKCDPALGR